MNGYMAAGRSKYSQVPDIKAKDNMMACLYSVQLLWLVDNDCQIGGWETRAAYGRKIEKQ